MKKINVLVLNVLFVSTAVFLEGCGDDDSPAPETFEPVIISADIVDDTRLEDINPAVGEADYIVTDYIDVEAVLTIDPGVVIAFEANAGFFIHEVNTANGAIIAMGTQSDPILFTGVQKSKGYWRGIAVESADARNEFNHVVLEYAGSDPIAAYSGVSIKGGVAIESVTGFEGSLKINNTTIQHCDGYGLIVEGGTLLREFSSNTFTDNMLAAVRIDAENVGAIDESSSYNDNGMDGVEINASGSPIHDITQDATWRALEIGAVYRVEQSFDVEAQLTIMPGATIEFEANQTAIFKQDLDIPLGILIAKGTASEPITFTGVVKSAGYWKGLIIQSNSVLNEMDHCIVEYGGSDPIAGELANIGVDKDGAFDAPELILTNSIIRNSAGCGVVVESASSTFTESDNTYSDNTGNNICN